MSNNLKDYVVILCREYDKYQGREPIVYKLDIKQEDMTNILLHSLNLRSRYNPELAYFLVLKENWEENKEDITNKIFREYEFEMFDSFIGNGSNVLENNGIVRI